MSVDNLPALRGGTDLAVIPSGDTAPEPVQNRLSEDFFLLAFVGAILTGSAAWGHMWAQTVGIGAGAAALAAAGIIERRREHRT
ncbi:hypothetical protein JNW88_08220 [Micromonospora sp. ATA32]|nr:hypothetical protein [Micromonospora sp. ATA32]